MLQVFNVILVSSIAGGIFSTVQDMVDNPPSIPEYVASSLPRQATYFIAYIMIQAFTALPLELLRSVHYNYFEEK